MSARSELAVRRDLLVARADLERVDLTVAARDLVDSFGTRGAVGRFRDTHPLLARALRLAIPVIGASRLGVVARAISLGIVAYRIVRALRGRRRAPGR
ncbi:MAG TPA: hypothetical protein VF925_06320 [Casimicrobiaceae bacterium]